MGLYQEVFYKRLGKHPEESLFYTHILPLPAFLVIFGNLRDHVMEAAKSPERELPLLYASVPSQFVYLAANMLMHFVCISSVYVLTTECTSLTVTLVVTLRKFFSLIFSVFYFKNTFTTYHWMGTLLVFVGTILFTDIVPQLRGSLQSGATNEKPRESRAIPRFYESLKSRVSNVTHKAPVHKQKPCEQIQA